MSPAPGLPPASEPTVGELLAEGRALLAASPIAILPREAALLLGRLLGLGEAQLLARDDRRVPAESARRFRRLAARRAAGEPVAYLLGEREFWGRAFAVDRRVLIPRPETEHLVEAALSQPLPPEPLIVELGTGSGCIAVTLAAELPEATVLAVDRSPGALAVAAGNARRHGVAGRVRLIAADWGHGVRVEHAALLVANPPYVEAGAALSPEVGEHEPGLALFGGEDGLAALRDLLSSLSGVLPGVAFLCEIGAGQSASVATIAAAAGWRLEGVSADYAGIPRVVRLRRR